MNMSSSLSTAGPSDSDAASSGSSSYFMCKLSTKMSKALGTRWEAKDLGQSAASGKAHVCRKIGNIRKKNRQPISELLERKIVGSCLIEKHVPKFHTISTVLGLLEHQFTVRET